MTLERLQEVAKSVRENGPVRVMIDEHEATTPSRAKREHGIEPSIVFIREDGWTLGANDALEYAAKNTWRGQWIGCMRAPFETVEPM